MRQTILVPATGFAFWRRPLRAEHEIVCTDRTKHLGGRKARGSCRLVQILGYMVDRNSPMFFF